MYLLSKFGEGTVIYEFRGKYGEALTDPLEYISLSLLITTLILLFFSDKVFNLWLRKFMIWFGPIALILIAMGSAEINFGWPTRTSMAINMGGIMVVVTLLFALVQRFYFKIK